MLDFRKEVEMRLEGMQWMMMSIIFRTAFWARSE